MGNYNSHYESYYNSIINKKNNNKYHNKHNGKKIVIRRIIQDLCGVLVLFLFIIICKSIVTPHTKAAYKYSKEVVNTNFDYKKFIKKVKSIDKDMNIKPQKIKDSIRKKISIPHSEDYIS